jgi:hypothetical protein
MSRICLISSRSMHPFRPVYAGLDGPRPRLRAYQQIATYRR